MLELNRLAVLLGVDGALADLGELGVGMYLDVVLADVLQQAGSGCATASVMMSGAISIMVTSQPCTARNTAVSAPVMPPPATTTFLP